MTDSKLAGLKAQLAELRSERKGVLAESADRLEHPDVVRALDAFDTQIVRIEKLIERHVEGQTERGRAAAEAARAKELAESKATALATVELCESATETSAAIDRHIEVLRDLLLKRRETRVNAVRAMHRALKPMGLSRHTTHPAVDLAHAPHGTIDALIDVLGSRELLNLNVAEHDARRAGQLRAHVEKLMTELGLREGGHAVG